VTKDRLKMPFNWVEAMKYWREESDKAKEDASLALTHILDVSYSCVDLLSALIGQYIDEKAKMNVDLYK